MRNNKIFSVILTIFMLFSIININRITTNAATKISTITLNDVVSAYEGKNPYFNISVPDDEHYIIKPNSIDWFDRTNWKHLNSSDKFEKGVIYQLSVVLQADDGYVFDDESMIKVIAESAAPVSIQVNKCGGTGDYYPDRSVKLYYYIPKDDECTVIYDSNGGTGYMPFDVKYKGGTLNLPNNEFIPPSDDYYFIRWNYGNIGDKINIGQSWNVVRIVAQWGLKPKTVTFNPNGGNVDQTSATSGADGKLESLPIPTRDSYKFDGWYTSKSGGTKIDTNYVFTADTILYAHWVSDNSTITFDAGGGSGTMTSVVKPNNSNWTVPECSFTSSDPDKEFDYWSTSDGNKVKPGDTINVTKDLKLTAQWKWKEGTPLLKEIHYYIPEPEPGVKPSNNIKITTVPANAFSSTFVDAVEKIGASHWRKSSDNSTYVEMESGESFKQGMYYRNEITATASVGLVAYLLAGKLFNKSVVRDMAPGLTTYINDVKTPASSDIVFLCRKSIESADVKRIEDQKYTGSEITPEIEVSIDGTKLVKDTDYTVTYSANKEPGTATVTIGGSGIYKGTKTITFKIVKDEPTPTPASTKDSADVTPDPAVTPTPVPTSGKFAQDDISPENPVKVEDIEKTILNIKDEKDTKGSTFTLLKAKGTPKSKKSIKLSWSKVPGAEKYMIYGNKCGKKNKYKYIATVTGTSYTAKKLKKGTYYKYTIVAVKGDEAIATSKTIHVTTDGGKKGNNTKVKLSKTKLSLAAGKSKKIKATLKSKKKVASHRKVAWESDNVTVATVKNGKITAVGKGTCYVYAYAQNGVSAKIKVTVK